MAGTPVNWQVTTVAKGPGQLWTKLAIPSAGGKLILDTDGTPEAAANPDAVHVGYTEAGSEFQSALTFLDFFVDEEQDPIIKQPDVAQAAITGNWAQILNFDILEVMLPGSVRADGAGYEGITFGGNPEFSYYSTALIFPLTDDPTLFGVFHLYKSINDPGLACQIGRKKLAFAPFAFRGVSIPTRAVGDRTGAYWKQTSVGS